MEKINIFWFRRDLRLVDNMGLYYACMQEIKVLPIFIFDKNILDDLEDKRDARVEFIHNQITKINDSLKKIGSSILVKYSIPIEVFQDLMNQYDIQGVYTNRDYEPYGITRDKSIAALLNQKNISFYDFKDHVIFEKGEIMNGSGEPYKVFTPYSKVWKEKFKTLNIQQVSLEGRENIFKPSPPLQIPSLDQMGFATSAIEIPSLEINNSLISNYGNTRDFPYENGTSRLGIHLRFGTISIRRLVLEAYQLNETYLNELIWREFYMMILAHYPEVIEKSFKPQYDQIPWRNDENEYTKWCDGKTGYPIVDAGMRELNTTGFMHNRVRMIVASFLTKHLLIDWRWGEAYFANKLLDFELSSNNGGWQWAAGSGTDAQPYFRIFNPETQAAKFDPDKKYIKKWVHEFGSPSYPKPIVEHKFARERALLTYQKALKS